MMKSSQRKKTIISIVAFGSICQMIRFIFFARFQARIVLDYSQHLAQCKLPDFFEDRLLLQFHRQDVYPGEVEKDDFIVGFTHLYQAGGSSLTSVLQEQAINANMDVRSVTQCRNFCVYKSKKLYNECFVNQQEGKNPMNSLERFKKRKGANGAEKCQQETLNVTNAVIYGHANFAEMESRLEHIHSHDRHYIAMFRDPVSRYESIYRNLAERYPKKYSDTNGRHDPQKFQDKFDEFLVKNRKLHSMTYLSQAAPADFLRDLGISNIGNIRTSDWKDIFPSKKLQCGAQKEIFQNVVDNYAVVGVLERMDDVMEVLRCRFPWFKGEIMPPPDPPVGFFKETPLIRHKNLTQLLTPAEDVLYEVANKILTADLHNCRGTFPNNES